MMIPTYRKYLARRHRCKRGVREGMWNKTYMQVHARASDKVFDEQQYRHAHYNSRKRSAHTCLCA